MLNFLPLIEAKRDGHPLAAADLRAVVAGYTAGRIPDYQMAAFLMAVCFQGLNAAETDALTLAMRDSGDVLQFPPDPRPLADKHSTGGVGDKVSLPLTPLLACLGLRVPMISGRGLGLTGGTLDKLESIPGFQTALPAQRVVAQVQRVGCIICGQTDRMVPADKALYALRDVTGTVPSIPLIVASILSKKLAEGLAALVLDVKFGGAAFMPTLQRADALARAMVRLGQRCGLRVRALLTDMNTPLGAAAGNWLEVRESVRCLERKGPADLQELVVACAAHLLVLTRQARSLAAARRQALACLASGQPLQKWEAMLAAQGADLEEYRRKLTLDTAAPVLSELTAPRAGWVTRCDARIIAEVIRDLGGGRLTKESVINPEVGVDRLAKPGARVAAGAVLARVHAADSGQAEAARARLEAAFAIARQPPPLRPLIRRVIGG
jgi:pyrimidine-nucleoside phosphorylase